MGRDNELNCESERLIEKNISNSEEVLEQIDNVNNPIPDIAEQPMSETSKYKLK